MEKMAIGTIISLGDDPAGNLNRVKERLGLTNVQVLCPPDEFYRGEKKEELIRTINDSGVTITTMFLHFEGESYSDILTIREMVGFLNPKFRDERLQISFRISDLARELGIDKIAAHIGFIPEGPNDSNYLPMVEAVRKLADHCAANGQDFCLETGQEAALVLLRFIKDVDRHNLKVNFDPGNMVLYGSGDPIEALDMVKDYVVSVHAKDGKWPQNEGELGTEYPLGEGDVGMDRFIATLKEIGYEGPITIEREITGEQQMKDILSAIDLLEELKKNA